MNLTNNTKYSDRIKAILGGRLLSSLNFFLKRKFHLNIYAYDKNARKYDLWYDINKYVFISELKALKDMIDNEGEGVEIGVGTGRFASHLGIKTGVEPSKNMARIAIKRGIKIINSFAEDILCPDEIFDYAVMVMTICFLENVEKTLNEIYRILKSRGKIYIGFADKNSFLGNLYQEKKKKSLFYKNANFYTPGDVKVFLTKANFEKIQFNQTIFKPLEQITETEPVIEGYGKGAFIVVKGVKKT